LFLGNLPVVAYCNGGSTLQTSSVVGGSARGSSRLFSYPEGDFIVKLQIAERHSLGVYEP